MRDLKNIGDSQITKMHKRRTAKPAVTMAEWCILGLCMFTTLYLAIRVY